MQTLRPYQVAALESLRREIRAGRRRPVLVAPTGSGKTTIASSMIHSAVAKGGSVLAIAHRRELITQLRDRLRDHDVETGVIMAGSARVDQPVMVASIQTLVRRDLPPAKIIIVDECHHARAATYHKIIDAYPEAVVVGLTATPWRLDGKGLGGASGLFDSIVVAATPAELLDQGYLCQATGHAYVPPDFGDVATKAGDYDHAGLSLAYSRSHVLGDIVSRWLEHCGPRVAPPRGRRTILFASSLENSRELIDRFRAEGISAEHLDYKVPAAERRAIIDRVRTGATTVISNVGILGEGVDVPELECAILARPTKSVGVYLQQVGRVLRTAAGKARAIVHDHAGNITQHGFWDDPRDYSLSADRNKSTGAAPTRTCPECFWVGHASATQCPECGYVFPAALSDVDDAHKELTLDQMREIRASGDTPEAREAFKNQLVQQALAKGLKAGWVVHKFLERYPGAPKPWKAFRRVRDAQCI